MSRRSSMRSASSVHRESSMEETCAMVDRLIQSIQRQIRDELGFRELVISTGEEADETTTMTGMRGSVLLSGDASFMHSRRQSMSMSMSFEPPSAFAPLGSSLPSAATTLSSSSSNHSPVDDLHKMRRAYQALAVQTRKTSESGSETSSSSCSECTRGTVFVSPNYDRKARVLVIVPYREAGIWSRSICMQQQGSNDTSGSMIAYLKKALAEDYGVVILNPAAQVCHPKNHVEQAWDQLIAPLSSDIYIIAYSRGTQFVKHLLAWDNGQGVMQDRLKALALVEPSHYVSDKDSYFARRILARRAVAWILSSEIDVGCKIPKAEARHGCICLSAGAVPMNVTSSSGAWALEMVMTSVFGSFAARAGETAGTLPCLIDPRRKNKSARNHKSPTAAALIERCSVFIQPQADEPISLGDFEIIKLIGRGACGRVKLVRKKHGSDEGAFYAMKAIKKKLVIQRGLRGLVEATNAERRILDRIDHPYIATLCYAFQNEAKLYLLSKYYPGGNLLDQMRLARRFPEDRTRLYAAEVALAIHHLHECDIIYRDLKLENVLVGSDGHVALTDFGMSKENMNQDGRTSTFVGTYQMMAPEVFTGKSYSRMVDWWALGVMVYEMIDGRTPFNAKTNKLIKERITNVDLKFSPRFTEDAKDFVSRLLTKSETDRPHGFEHIKRHPWFKGIDWERVGRKEYTFEGQEELMNTHAKEYSTADIFDTYMNTLEVPVDTPASVKSDGDPDLFNDFEFNHLDSAEDDDIEYESPVEDGIFELEVDDVVEDEDEHAELRDQIAPPLPPIGDVNEEALDKLLVRTDSHFDISLLRPQQATDFGSSVSSLSSSSETHKTEKVSAAEEGSDVQVRLSTKEVVTVAQEEEPTAEVLSVSPPLPASPKKLQDDLDVAAIDLLAVPTAHP
ncbi:hypothetical protein P43SY_001912 [Pythium insidiosum]|uniref:Protein kinase domain-containing protein n=1 Tax=Pythium insidiosum TaxID=114742 RepID=A0AAD5Q8C5_PYTIN|nr:hypothetical protein P43SY_001912 [Pythium insidiosum]